MSWILGIDTSSIDLGIGLFQDTQPVCAYNRHMRYSHAEHIDQGVRFLIETSGITPEQIDRVAVTIGPGSFTGLRIGLAFVRGFCMGRTVPVLPVSSLHVMAQSQRSSDGTVLTAIDARNDDVFWASFSIVKGVVTRITDDCLSPVDKMRYSITPNAIIVTDTQGYAQSSVFMSLEAGSRTCPVERFPIQRGLLCAEIGSEALKNTEEWHSPGDLLPNYLRLSAAQIKAGS
jgi:tRNA threonylcarbamoyladenosine biosynthesis protein TsaB